MVCHVNCHFVVVVVFLKMVIKDERRDATRRLSVPQNTFGKWRSGLQKKKIKKRVLGVVVVVLWKEGKEQGRLKCTREHPTGLGRKRREEK